MPVPMDSGSALMRTKYITQFCTLCMVETDHVELLYNDKKVITCQNCQDSYEVKEDEEVTRNETYVYSIASLEEICPSSARRLNIIEVMKETFYNDTLTKTEYIMMQYPAYGMGKHATHYPTSVEFLDSTAPNHMEQKAVTEQIKLFIGDKP